MINKKTKNIFKAGIILSMAIIAINNLKAEETKEVKVKFRNKGKISVSLRCRADNGNRCRNIITNYPDSITTPNFNHKDTCAVNVGHNDYVDCVIHDIYKHTFSDGSVMYSASSDPNHFANSANNLEWYFDTMDLLKAMPQIGTSRIDPNLIEY